MVRSSSHRQPVASPGTSVPSLLISTRCSKTFTTIYAQLKGDVSTTCNSPCGAGLCSPILMVPHPQVTSTRTMPPITNFFMLVPLLWLWLHLCSAAARIAEEGREKCTDRFTGPLLGATAPPHRVAMAINQIRCRQATEFIAGADGTIAVQQGRELEVVFVHERRNLLTVFLHGHSPYHKWLLPQRLV